MPDLPILPRVVLIWQGWQVSDEVERVGVLSVDACALDVEGF